MEKVNVREVSAAPTERFTKRICFNDPQVLVFVLTFGPGQSLPKHKHENSKVVLHVHAGSGVMLINGQETPAAQGDVFLVAGDEELAVQNTGDQNLVLLVSLSPNPSNPAFAKPV